MIRILPLAMLAAALALAGCVNAPKLESGYAPNPIVGGAAMLPTKNIVENASKSQDHATLVAALKATGLAETLTGPGPFTVFAPVDAAFASFHAGPAGRLLKPENRTALTRVLTYHLVLDRIDSAELARRIKAGGGRTSLRTASSGTLFFTMRDGLVVITDETGASAAVTIADVRQVNGVIHVIDRVLTQK